MTIGDDDVDYSKYSKGDIVNGITIHHILLQYRDAIVFTSPTERIYFWHRLGERGDEAVVEFYRLTSKCTARLKEAYRRQVNNLLGAALAEALSMPAGADLKKAFVAVDAFIDAHGPIEDVFGHTEEWVVYLDPDGDLICDYPAVSEEAAPLLTEFYRLQQLGNASLPADENRALNKILGTELSIALQRTPAPSVEDAFSASRDYIQLRNESRMRALYISASLVAAVVFGLACWAIIRDDLGLLLGCVGGIIGATISVLQRSATLEIRRFLPRAQVAIQGGVRITLGVLFGLLIVAASRSGIALSSFASSANSLFLAGVAAGFSERFIPDLLTKITSEGSSGNQAAATKAATSSAASGRA
ncbi:MAG TPA: hypothetical protein VF787_09320 [Thermoanaerobaculia bacterium]